MEILTTRIALFIALFIRPAFSFDPILSTGCSSDLNCTTQFPDSYCDFDRKVDCDEGVCMCKQNHVPVPLDPIDPNKLSCLPKAADIHDPCKHENECIGAFGELSSCVPNGPNTTCECTGSSVYCEQPSLKVMGCVRPAQNLGDPCHCDSHCGAGIRGAICANDPHNDDPWRCRCGDDFGVGVDYVESEDGSKCVPTARLLGESCDQGGSRQCKEIHDSVCDSASRTCACNAETHIPNSSNTSCYAKREHLGMDCSYSFQCPQGSQCLESNVCGCSVVHVESALKPDTCLPQVIPLEKCEEDAQCVPTMGPNSECTGPAANKTCECKHGHYFYVTHDIEHVRCYPYVPLGGRCKDRRQCVDAMGSGVNKTCQSVSGDHSVCTCHQWYGREHEGMCLVRAHIGDECTSDVQCQLWNDGAAICDSVTKKCACDEYYQANLYDNGCDLI